MDYRKEYEERVSKIKVSELTIEDKRILVKHYLSEAHSYFQSALGYAEELDYRFVQDCMDEAKSMVDYAEEQGADMGSWK
jgi:hypothetical protein